MENNTFDQVSFNSWLDTLEEFLISLYWPIEEADWQRLRPCWKEYFLKGIDPQTAFFMDQSKSDQNEEIQIVNGKI
ncbi:hypothetical protein [Pedobacter antarcticus]|uniref:hypothetical protein n=1 Tax=Pedobacter antarcticus TaxID=34086 RepID=UPI00293185A6|nr:hypothetical protein [Pedobacter antarcticus]